MHLILKEHWFLNFLQFFEEANRKNFHRINHSKDEMFSGIQNLLVLGLREYRKSIVTDFANLLLVHVHKDISDIMLEVNKRLKIQIIEVILQGLQHSDLDNDHKILTDMVNDLMKKFEEKILQIMDVFQSQLHPLIAAVLYLLTLLFDQATAGFKSYESIISDSRIEIGTAFCKVLNENEDRILTAESDLRKNFVDGLTNLFEEIITAVSMTFK